MDFFFNPAMGSTREQVDTAFHYTFDDRLTPGERRVVQQIKHSEDPPCYYHHTAHNPFRVDPGKFLYSQPAQNVLDNLQNQYGRPRGW